MEFDLIRKYFGQRWALDVATAPVWSLGIGDDCAAGSVPGQLLVSKDLLTAGVHFFEDCDPSDLGWKSLAVNLSDLAAMGAKPEGFLLGLGLSEVSEPWLEAFSDGLLEISRQFACPLIGGDTTRVNAGPVVSVTVLGSVEADVNSLKRSGGCLGDEIWVSGCPGMARLGLLMQADARGRLAEFLPELAGQRIFRKVVDGLPASLRTQVSQAIARPIPRIELGRALLGRANAAIDLSDGLSGDLRHLCSSSGLGAVIDYDALVALWAAQLPEADAEAIEFLAAQSVQGGDDYELCFLVSELKASQMQALSRSLGLALHRIGRMSGGEAALSNEMGGDSLSLLRNGALSPLADHSFKHFNHFNHSANWTGA